VVDMSDFKHPKIETTEERLRRALRRGLVPRKGANLRQFTVTAPSRRRGRVVRG